MRRGARAAKNKKTSPFTKKEPTKLCSGTTPPEILDLTTECSRNIVRILVTKDELTSALR